MGNILSYPLISDRRGPRQRSGRFVAGFEHRARGEFIDNPLQQRQRYGKPPGNHGADGHGHSAGSSAETDCLRRGYSDSPGLPQRQEPQSVGSDGAIDGIAGPKTLQDMIAL